MKNDTSKKAFKSNNNNNNNNTNTRIFKNFKEACSHYKFPGSHQIGSYGPKGQGIVRSYSNGTCGKDFISDNKKEVLYRLKSEIYKEKFLVNQREKRKIRFFRKINNTHKTNQGTCEDLGLFLVDSFTKSGHVKLISCMESEEGDEEAQESNEVKT